MLFPGSVLLLLLFVITEEIYQEHILCQRGHCVIFQFPVFEFLALPFFLSLLSSFLSLWFYGNGEATERGSSSRRFFSKTTPFEHLGLGTGLFHYFSPKGVTLMCRLWFMGTRGLHTPDLTTLTAKPRAANPVTIPRPSHQSEQGFSGGGGLGAKPVGCEGSLFSGSRVSGPVLGCRQCAGASRLPPEPGASP